MMNRTVCSGLAVLFATACLAMPARGDEMKYLSEKTHVIMSLDVQKFLKSKTLVEIKDAAKRFGGPEEDLEVEMGRSLGVPLSNVARITMALMPKEGGGEHPMAVVTFLKPVRAEDILAAKKIGKDRLKSKVTHTQLKLGDATIYEEEWELTFDPVQPPVKYKAESFTVVDGKTLLFGKTESIKDALERKKPATLSKNIQTGLSLTPLTEPVIVVVDFEGMSDKSKALLFRGLGLAEKQHAENVRLAALKATEDGKLSLTATLVLKDAPSAAATQKALEKGVTELKAKLKEGAGKVPPQFEDIFKGAQQALENVKFSTKEDRITGTLSVEPRVVIGFFMVVGDRGPPDSIPETKEAKEDGKE